MSRWQISITSCGRTCARSCRGFSRAAIASSSMRPPSRPRLFSSAATPRRCSRAGSPSSVRRRTSIRRPRDLTTAKVFSDPPINTAPVTKLGNDILIGGAVKLPAGNAAAAIADGEYTIGIRPHHITPRSEGDGTARRGPGSGRRAQRVRKRRPLRSQRSHLGVAVARHPSFRGRLDGAAPRRR